MVAVLVVVVVAEEEFKNMERLFVDKGDTMKIISVVLIISVLFIVGCSSTTPTNDALAQCLTDNGVAMYGAEWCSHCQNQKKMFGDSFRLINYVDCDKNTEVCQNAGVTGYPTWIVNGQSYPGEQSLENLALLAGC